MTASTSLWRRLGMPLCFTECRFAVLRAAAFAILAWAALLCAVLSASVGVATQAVFGNLTANHQSSQRHGGSLPFARVSSSEQSVLAAEVRASDLFAPTEVLHFDGALLAVSATAPSRTWQSDEPAAAVTAPMKATQRLLPPIHAPPFLL